ncbi:hypothetical protein BJ742DRAFT_779862 [Cladochytrium replicatum]|nr:hypothetical protein BJ742DRAFT_779862 [Cladochytrium replicatum]
MAPLPPQLPFAAFDLVLQPAFNPVRYDVGKECSNIIECLQNEKRFSKLLEKHGDKLRNDWTAMGGPFWLPPAFEHFDRSPNPSANLAVTAAMEARMKMNLRILKTSMRKDAARVARVALIWRMTAMTWTPNPARRKGRNDKHEMEELLEYHIIEDNVHHKHMYEGKLLRTKLKLDELDGKHQRVRVHEVQRRNFQSRVEEHMKLRPKKSSILAISRVLCLPIDAMDMMALMPEKFSTTLVAAGKTKLLDEIVEL